MTAKIPSSAEELLEKPFTSLISQILLDDTFVLIGSPFAEVLNYQSTRAIDAVNNAGRCISVRTYTYFSPKSSAVVMNAVASKNRRCPNPAFAFSFTWPDSETLLTENIFDVAESVLNYLGFEDHQAVVAIHTQSTVTHCHVIANRINPRTYHSIKLSNLTKNQLRASRKFGVEFVWSNENQ